MEFWGVEVKSGKSLKVVPEENKIIHLSSACLGEVSKDKGNEPVSLYVKFGDKKVQLGTLSSEKFPQTSYDLVFEKEFELSHNWKYGSVFLTGYKFASENVSITDDGDEDSDDFDEEDITLNAAANGKPEFKVKTGAKPGVNGAKQKETLDPTKNEKDDEKDVTDQEEEESSESDSEEDSGDEKPKTNGHVGINEDDDDSDEDDDSDDSDDEETLVKAEGSSKRVHESSKKTPAPEKKAKFVTPEKKTGGHSGGVHVDTPYPKPAGKSAANNKQQTPKSNGDYSCKLCNGRSFKTEDALGSHNKAKHSAK